MAIFKANSSSTPIKKKKRVLCYTHYDVVAADDSDKWSNDPFEMTGKNGWVYGRGVSDNKVRPSSTVFDLRELIFQFGLGTFIGDCGCCV